MTWINTVTDEQANVSSVEFWERLRSDLNDDRFWADKIKEFRGEPVKRLSMAIDNLPLPGAFKEASVALRALIREKRKAKELYNEELALLYWLGAVDSFSIPYSSYLEQPGYNVLESIPGEVIKTLTFTYYDLGYEKLGLLNKTDIKWCVDAWGEPKEHTTLHEMHKDIWCRYEKLLPEKQKKALDARLANL